MSFATLEGRGQGPSLAPVIEGRWENSLKRDSLRTASCLRYTPQYISRGKECSRNRGSAGRTSQKVALQLRSHKKLDRKLYRSILTFNITDVKSLVFKLNVTSP